MTEPTRELEPIDHDATVLEVLMNPNAPDFPTLSELIGWPGWMDRAACRGVDLATFFNVVNWRLKDRTIVAYCLRCPVLAECREYAIADPDIEGLWAGTMPSDRKRIRRKRAWQAKLDAEALWEPGEW